MKGVILVRRSYRPTSRKRNWDHDHCEFCGAKFMQGDHPEVLHAGYATLDEQHWICEPCFDDFRGEFNWRIESASGGVDA